MYIQKYIWQTTIYFDFAKYILYKSDTNEGSIGQLKPATMA